MSQLVTIKKLKITLDLKLLIDNTVSAENEENNPTLSSYYEKCINQAIVDGWPRQEISAKLLKELDLKLFQLKKLKQPNIHEEECKINRTSFHRVARRLECTNPKFNPNQEATHVLPENSSIPEINVESYNLLSDIINLCHEVQNKIKKDNRILFEIFEKNVRDNFYKECGSLIKNIDAGFDNKVKIPQNIEETFVRILCDSTMALNEGATQFMMERLKLLKSQGKKIITLKQTNKFLRNQSSSKLELFHPHDLQQALFDGFVGVQCIKCLSWKVRFHEIRGHTLHCEDCTENFPAINIPRCQKCHLLFYRENILKIIENNSQCPQCQAPLTLYEDLKMWALQG